MKYLKIYMAVQFFLLYILFLLFLMIGGSIVGAALFNEAGAFLSLVFTVPIMISTFIFVCDKIKWKIYLKRCDMKLNLETKYNIHEIVKYKRVDTFGIFEAKEPAEEIKESEITAIEIQVGYNGTLYIQYILENEDVVCSDAIIGYGEEQLLWF